MSQADPTTSLSTTNVPNAEVKSTIAPPWLVVVFAILIAEIGTAVAKQLFDAVGPSGVVLLRTSMACGMFLVLRRPRIRGYSRQDYALVLLYGMCIAGMMLTFYGAISRIPLGITVAIAFAGPLCVAVFGSRRLADLLWVALAAGGIILLSPLTNADIDAVGLILAVASALAWAVFILISGRVTRTFPQSDGLTIAMGIAALVAIPFGLSGAVNVVKNPALLGLSLVVALLSSALPFFLEFWALRKLSPAVYGLLVSVEPVIATIIGFVVLREALGARELLGIAMVTVAASATARSSSK